MRKKYSRFESFTIVILILVSIFGFWWYLTKYSYRSRADNERVNITLSPQPDATNMIVPVGQERVVTYLIESANGGKISGVDINFLTEGVLRIVSVKKIAHIGTGDSRNFTILRDEVAGTTRRTIVASPSSQTVDLPSHYMVQAVVKADTAGEGKIKINTTTAQIVGPITGRSYYLTAVDGNFTFTNSTAPAGNVTINLKLKLQGVARKSSEERLNTQTVSVGVDNGSPATQPSTNPVIFRLGDTGVWTGSTAFNLQVGPKYRLFIKGPKHVRQKICDASPRETQVGSYKCDAPDIPLTEGVNNLDFTGITQLAGDVNQDGVVNSADLVIVRNNVGKSENDAVDAADINLDGVVNGQDFSLVIYTLSNRYDD